MINSLIENDDLVLKALLNSFQTPYLLFNQEKQLKLHNLSNEYLKNISPKNDPSLRNFVATIFATGKTKSKNLYISKGQYVIAQGIPITKNNKIISVMIVFKTSDLNLEEYQNMAIDLKTVFESSYDALFVSDADGNAVRVSNACEELWGIKQEDLVGCNIYDLEKAGVFQPSVTRMVLEQKQKISMIQKTRTGRTLSVFGIPVIDNAGKITRVINASHDITEVDQLQKELNDMRKLLKHYQQEAQIHKSKSHLLPYKKLIYKSEKIDQIVKQIQIIAKYNTPVLIIGESGVGKELISDLIHEWSNRSNQPFIRVNCSAIPNSLLESELFGYEKGTFTGANKEGKRGLFQAANKGTILLDEISELPVSLQAKLLRVLQEKEITPVGGTKTQKIDVRIISACNKDISQLIKTGEFREDLYYRLNGIPLEIPPLRSRKSDIEPLVEYFTTKFNSRYDESKNFDNDAMTELIRHDWKGNVRELKNFTERLLILSQKKTIDKSHVEYFLEKTENRPQEFNFEVNGDIDLYQTLDFIEKEIISYSLNKHKKTTDVAHSLNVSQSTISKKLKKYGINISSSNQ